MRPDDINDLFAELAPKTLPLIQQQVLEAAAMLAPKEDGIFAPFRTDPVRYAKEVLGIELLSDMQVELLTLLAKPQDDDWHGKLAVGSAVNYGKTFIGGVVCNWYFDCFGPCIIATTAPSQQSVKDLLWKEIRVQRARANARWGIGEKDFIGPQATEMRRAPDWWARGYVAAKGENFKGRHVHNMMFLFDESVGLSELYFRATKLMFKPSTSMLWLAFFNPTDTSSAMYQEIIRPDSTWSVMELSALDHPNIIAALNDEPLPIPSAVSLEQLEEAMLDGCEPVSAADHLETDFEWIPGSGDWWRPDAGFEGEFLGRWPSGDDSALWSDALWKAVTKPLTWDQVRIDAEEIPRIGADIARHGCFDDKTEILTDSGWKLFADLSGSENVLSIPVDGNVAEWRPIDEIHRYEFDGELNLCEQEGMSFAITDNHRLLWSSVRNRKVWKLSEFQDMPKDFVIRRCSSWTGNAIEEVRFSSIKPMPNGGSHDRSWAINPLEWCRFLGWFMSEGSVYREAKYGRYSISIAQIGHDKRAKIKALIKRMGLRSTIEHNKVRISNNEIGKHLLAHCGHGAANKRIPKYIKDSSQEQIEAFLDAFCDGDGTRRNGKRLCYYTSSKIMADDIQEMLVKIGRAGKVTKRFLAGSTSIIQGRVLTRKSDGWTVFERDYKTDAWIYHSNLQRMPYKGFVYCVSTPLKTIMVRRNGCIMWSGNSDKTCIHVSWGDYSVHHESRGKVDPARTTGRIIELADLWEEKSNEARKGTDAPLITGKMVPIMIDDDGVGGTIASFMRERGYRVFPIGAATKATKQNRYRNKRSELWFVTRERAKLGKLKLGLLPAKMLMELRRQAMAPLWSLNSAGQREVEPKDDTKKRLGRSPDDMDSCNLSYYVIDSRMPEVMDIKGTTFQERMEATKDERQPTWQRREGRRGIFRRN